MTPTLLTPWHDLDRLARAAQQTGPKFVVTMQIDRPNDSEAVAAFNRWKDLVMACSPERILSLLDARGAEDTARLDAADRLRVDAERHDPGRGDPLHVGYVWKLTGHLHQRTIRQVIDDLLAPIDAARAVPPALDGPAGAVHEQNNAEG